MPLSISYRMAYAENSMKIVLLDDYQDVARSYANWKQLPRSAELTVINHHIADIDELVATLFAFEVIGVMRERTPFPRRLLERLPNLKLLVTTGQRNDSIDLEAAKMMGVKVAVAGFSGNATAELTFALILALARGLKSEFQSMDTGGWQTHVGRSLEGSTLGVIGLGRLGARVAGLGTAFGMHVKAWSKTLTHERARKAGATLVSREELFESADFLTLHLKLMPKTCNLIGLNDFRRMKTDASFINTSRSELIDTCALLKALDEGRPGSAALDVYDLEPLAVESPLRNHQSLLLTPHIGYVNDRTYKSYYQSVLEVILAYSKNEPIRML